MRKILLVTNRKNGEVCGKFDNTVSAHNETLDFIDSHNEDLDESDDDYLTIFDFDCKWVEEEEPNVTIPGYNEAKEYIGLEPRADVKLGYLNPKHLDALIALNELFTIAEAWNKADDFTPDFSDSGQYKWYPWFVYDKEAAGFVYASTSNAPTYTSSDIGSRLCFKTRNRAIQFGQMFAHLYNRVFLINE